MALEVQACSRSAAWRSCVIWWNCKAATLVIDWSPTTATWNVSVSDYGPIPTTVSSTIIQQAAVYSLLGRDNYGLNWSWRVSSFLVCWVSLCFIQVLRYTCIWLSVIRSRWVHTASYKRNGAYQMNPWQSYSSSEYVAVPRLNSDSCETYCIFPFGDVTS